MASDIITTLSSLSVKDQRDSAGRDRKNYEDFVVVWVDKSLNKTMDNKKAFADIRKAVNRLETFEEPKECVDYISSVKYEKVFLIISGSLGQNVIPQLQPLQQIASVYVFCSYRTRHEE